MLQYFICIVFELSCSSVVKNYQIPCFYASRSLLYKEQNGKCIKVVNVSGIQSGVVLTGTIRCLLTPNFVSVIVFMSVFCQLYTLLGQFYTISPIYSIFFIMWNSRYFNLNKHLKVFDNICLQLFMIYTTLGGLCGHW